MSSTIAALADVFAGAADQGQQGSVDMTARVISFASLVVSLLAFAVNLRKELAPIRRAKLSLTSSEGVYRARASNTGAQPITVVDWGLTYRAGRLPLLQSLWTVSAPSTDKGPKLPKTLTTSEDNVTLLEDMSKTDTEPDAEGQAKRLASCYVPAWVFLGSGKTITSHWVRRAQ
jgi:hypothetical protein